MALPFSWAWHTRVKAGHPNPELGTSLGRKLSLWLSVKKTGKIPVQAEKAGKVSGKPGSPVPAAGDAQRPRAVLCQGMPATLPRPGRARLGRSAGGTPRPHERLCGLAQRRKHHAGCRAPSRGSRFYGETPPRLMSLIYLPLRLGVREWGGAVWLLCLAPKS